MKHMNYFFAFLLGLFFVSCGNNDDEILSPEGTRLAEEGYLPEMEAPSKIYYNEQTSFVLVKSDQRESFFKKLHDAEVHMYIIHPESAEDWTGYPFYDKVRDVLVAMNYKELEEMDEVVYAAPFISIDYGPEAYSNGKSIVWGSPDLRGSLSFQCFSSDEKKIVEQYAEENGLVVTEGEVPWMDWNPGGTVTYSTRVFTYLYFSKDSKVFITDAVAQLREKGIAATIPSYPYTHEGWTWYIP